MKAYYKTVIQYDDLYTIKFTKNPTAPYCLFIHGGPGFNCGVMEYLIEHGMIFSSLNYNIILYDQRTCGRSKNEITNAISHQDNLDDLEHLITYIKDKLNLSIVGLIGHSYGAKLLYDYYQISRSLIPGVFISMADSLLVPRLNNLMLDFLYLKKTDPVQYRTLFSKLNRLNLKDLVNISDDYAFLFEENQDRAYLYWANLDWFFKIQKIQKEIDLPVNQKTFKSVREDLYSDESTLSVNINRLNIKKLWINGFHDFVMDATAVPSLN